MTPAVATHTILAVDDTPANLSLLAGLLGEAYRIKIATNGLKALELARAEPPDLVLLDIMMPAMSGYETLERMHADAELSHIPVIMISAIEEIDSVIRCVELGAEDYLTKPFNPTLLRARVGATLEKKRLRDEVRAQAAQLAEWNRLLEQRVREQVTQLERLGTLKRFFAPQLVDLITSGGGEQLLKTHRREVVVAFADMRGFTSFTDRCEPEEVMAILAAYHRAMGELIMAHEGTLERFAGDGMMIFFNDPLELENPAANAVRMAVAMQARFGELADGWRKRGHELALGIGIAQGYATLGEIGFEGRRDYACIGGVTNLAARLCGQARPGQILADRRAVSSMEGLVGAQSLGRLKLEGITHPLEVFSIAGLK